uniref:Phage protein n=1 Tax=Panagrellus redivivus TaxID=6233 RepID=A0A7E4VLL5_PANRE
MNTKTTSFVLPEEVYCTHRDADYLLLAVLILCFAVSIAFTKTFDIPADLEKLSPEELVQFIIETLRVIYADFDGEADFLE